MSHTKAGRALTELILEIFRFNGRLLAAGDRLAKPLGLTSARWQVLGMIEAQSLSVAQIARKMGLARQNVQRLADVLEKERIVEYAANPDHQRAKLVRLTEQGRTTMKKLGERQELWANKTASVVSASEIEAAKDVVKKLRSRLEADRVARNQSLTAELQPNGEGIRRVYRPRFHASEQGLGLCERLAQTTGCATNWHPSNLLGPALQKCIAKCPNTARFAQSGSGRGALRQIAYKVLRQDNLQSDRNWSTRGHAVEHDRRNSDY